MAGVSLNALQWVALLFYALGVVTSVVYETRRTNNISALPFLLVALHGCIYYLTVYLASVFPAWRPPWYEVFSFQDWSAALRLQGAMTIAIVFGIEAYEQTKARRLSRIVEKVNGRHVE